MIIYVVEPGDTLFDLARRYGVSVQSIVDLNRLQELPFLVLGQALVIPATEFPYLIRPGDTLWVISRRFNVSIADIVRINRLVNPNLIYPGTVLRIPQVSENYGNIEVNGYIELSGTANDLSVVTEVGNYLTYLSPFSYQISVDGTLVSLNDIPVIAAASSQRAAPLMVLTNFRNGNFDSGLVHTILSNVPLQQILLQNVLSVMKAKGYYGLNIDFERIPPEDRELYNNFLRLAAEVLHAQNYPLSTALAPKTFDILTGEWHGAHDYRAHGEIADFVVIMTYEWGWSGGPPMAVAPINEVKKVLDYAVSVMPANKILMGMPLYGYNWSVPYTAGGPWAPRVSPQQALQLAAKYGAVINYDVVAEAPFFNYVDEAGIGHVVWFEDARSVRAKLLLVPQYGLRGSSYWVLGMDFPQNWAVLENMFKIVKVI